MINRELIRIKTLQLTYAYYQNGYGDLLVDEGLLKSSKSSIAQLRKGSTSSLSADLSVDAADDKRLLEKSIDKVEKELLFSLDKAYELYHVLLSLIVAVHTEMVHRYEVRTARCVREGLDVPSTRFAENRFALQLSENEMLNSYIAAHNPDWHEHIDIVRRLCQQIEQSNVYADYMSAECETDYDTDREVWRKLYKLLIADSDVLDDFLEEKSLYWNDDKTVVDDFVLKTIKRFREKNGSDQSLLPAWHDDGDRAFAVGLLRASLLHAEEYHEYMRSASEHWDFERIAFMDVIIMQMALAEMCTFTEIPVNVTINEYVELSKLYSTSKSSTYINAMLDAIARELATKGKLMKTMKNEL